MILIGARCDRENEINVVSALGVIESMKLATKILCGLNILRKSLYMDTPVHAC